MYFCPCVTSVLDGAVGQYHAPAALPQAKSHGTHSTGDWVGLGASLDGYGNLDTPGFELRNDQPISDCYTGYDIPDSLVVGIVTLGFAGRRVLQETQY